MRSMLAFAAVSALFLVTAPSGAATATTSQAWQYKDADPAVLEYHVLLMKLAGIDGDGGSDHAESPGRPESPA